MARRNSTDRSIFSTAASIRSSSFRSSSSLQWKTEVDDFSRRNARHSSPITSTSFIEYAPSPRRKMELDKHTSKYMCKALHDSRFYFIHHHHVSRPALLLRVLAHTHPPSNRATEARRSKRVERKSRQPLWRQHRRAQERRNLYLYTAVALQSAAECSGSDREEEQRQLSLVLSEVTSETS